MSESAIVQMLMSGRDDLQWYESNLDVLHNKFNNRFIAFRQAKVIDTDADFDKLLKKLKAQKINPGDVFIKFITDVKTIL